MKFKIDNNEVYFLFQPKFKNGNKISIEALMRVNGYTNIEEFINTIDCKKLDLFVIDCISKILQDNYNQYVSINVTTCSLECSHFINTCILLFKNKKIILEMTEQCSTSDFKKLNSNIKKLNKNNIYVFIDDIGKCFNQTTLLHKVKFNGIKIDREYIKDIHVNFEQYKYLVALKTQLALLGYNNIIYEGVENKTQEELLSLFNENLTVQGYLYSKPITLDQIKEMPDTMATYNFDMINHDYKDNIEQIAYNIITNNNAELQLCLLDPTSSIFSSNIPTMIKNIRNIIYKTPTYIENALLLMINNSDKLFVIRDEQGMVIYENLKHKDFIGISLLQKNPIDLIENIPDYKKCLDNDNILIKSHQCFMIKDEIFNDKLYITCRQKITHNNKAFILTTVNSHENSIVYQKDTLTNCYTRDLIKNIKTLDHLHKKLIIAYIDLDGFKLINDIYGHALGDTCLKEFISILRAHLKSDDMNDIIVRIGGDEFIILFNTNDLKVIDQKMSYINKKVIEHFKNKGIILSFSYGLAIHNSIDINETIVNADKNMYLNKYKNRKIEKI
ncbi:MAG: GGDEF domain-containing protein [Vibrio sp.]